MVQVNFARKEVNCKIVYYGPGLSGKTTNIEVIYEKAPKDNRGELTSIATEGDRTLFFDFMPLELGNVAGMNTKFQLYTVPGQVYYNSTRKLVLQGADGIVFVADSQVNKLDENLESLQNLEENLREYGMDIATMPIVLQYNKRDLPNVMSVEFMNEKLNKWSHPYHEATAFQGIGVFQTLKTLAGMVLDSINKGGKSGGSPAGGGPKQQPAASPGGGYGGPPPGGGYGGPPPGGGYGAPPGGGYGAPPGGGYGAPPGGGYGAPPGGGYGAPPGGYGAPPGGGYGAPPGGGYGAPPGGYGAPPPGMAPRPGGYATPPPGMAPRPGGYATPPPGMAPRPGGYGGPPGGGYGAPPGGYGGYGGPPPGSGGYPNAPQPGGGYPQAPRPSYGGPPPNQGYPTPPRPGGPGVPGVPGQRPPEMSPAGPAPRPPYPPRSGGVNPQTRMIKPGGMGGAPKPQNNPYGPKDKK